MNIPNWAQSANQSFFQTGSVPGATTEPLPQAQAEELAAGLATQMDDFRQSDNSQIDLNPAPGQVDVVFFGSKIEGQYTGDQDTFHYAMAGPGLYNEVDRHAGETRMFSAAEIYGQNWVKGAVVRADGSAERFEQVIGQTERSARSRLTR